MNNIKITLAKHITLLLLLWSLLIPGFSQFSFYKNYTVNDGLPSSKAYDMLQDSKGYMWFATENGVSRFDGYDFKNFTLQDGLPTNSTIGLYEDYKGRIWFLSFRGSISYFENERIYPHILNDEILDLNIRFFNNICIDSADNIWLTPFANGEFKITRTNELISTKESRSNNSEIFYNTSTLFFKKRQNGYTLVGDVEIPEKKYKYDIIEDDGGIYLKYNTYLFQQINHKHFCNLKDNSFLISFGFCLRHINKSEIVYERMFENAIIDIYQDINNNIWVSEQFNCVYMFPNGNLSAEPIKFLSNSSVSGVLQNENGGYWFSTTKNGVFYVPSLQFTCYDKDVIGIENDVILSLHSAENELFFSTENQGVYSLSCIDNEFKINQNFQIEGDIISNINDVMVSSEGALWLLCTEFLKYNSMGKRESLIFPEPLSGNKIIELSDENVILTTSSGFAMFSQSELLYWSHEFSFDKRTFTVHESTDSTIWLGTIEGLYTFENNIVEKYHKKDLALSSRISDIKSIGNEIWVGTFDNGIAIIADDTIKYINKINGLSSNRIKVMFFENDTTLWVGTNRGLNQVLIAEDHRIIKEIVNYTIWDGLPSNEINDIIKHKDHIWLGTDNGMVSFNPKKLLKNQKTHELHFENIKTITKDIVVIDKSADLKYNNNDIEFYYKGICFNDAGNLNYSHILEGLDDSWSETKNTSVKYSNLKPGRFKFKVKVQNSSGLWSEPIQFNFTIHKHFTQTIIFKSGIIILILSFLFLIFIWVLKAQKRKADLVKQALLAEQKALQSQMNPHFIFNSLNSIHNYILEKNEINAGLYLAKFSSLMRRILDNSKKSRILLKDEIETIKLYLNLEKLRFEERFDFSIFIDDNINPMDIYMPTMILQPYLENSIRHGLVPKKSRGTLNVSFKRKAENSMIILIEDDGIGRQKAAEISEKKLNYKPTGMKNTENRIKLLNKLNKSNLKVSIIDLSDKNQIAIGTRVELVIDI